MHAGAKKSGQTRESRSTAGLSKLSSAEADGRAGKARTTSLSTSQATSRDAEVDVILGEPVSGRNHHGRAASGVSAPESLERR